MSWKDFLKIIGTKWKAGRNVPFDPLAAIEAKKSKLKVIIINGNNLKNFKNVLYGKKFNGTVIK